MEIIEEENIEDEEIGDEKKHKHEIDMTDGSVLKKMLLSSLQGTILAGFVVASKRQISSLTQVKGGHRCVDMSM